MRPGRDAGEPVERGRADCRFREARSQVLWPEKYTENEHRLDGVKDELHLGSCGRTELLTEQRRFWGTSVYGYLKRECMALFRGTQ